MWGKEKTWERAVQVEVHMHSLTCLLGGGWVGLLCITSFTQVGERALFLLRTHTQNTSICISGKDDKKWKNALLYICIQHRMADAYGQSE